VLLNVFSVCWGPTKYMITDPTSIAMTVLIIIYWITAFFHYLYIFHCHCHALVALYVSTVLTFSFYNIGRYSYYNF